MVLNHVISPPCNSLIGLPVREDRIAGPDSSNILTTIGIVQKNAALIAISINAIVVRGVIRISSKDQHISEILEICWASRHSMPSMFRYTYWECKSPSPQLECNVGPLWRDEL